MLFDYSQALSCSAEFFKLQLLRDKIVQTSLKLSRCSQAAFRTLRHKHVERYLQIFWQSLVSVLTDLWVDQQVFSVKFQTVHDLKSMSAQAWQSHVFVDLQYEQKMKGARVAANKARIGSHAGDIAGTQQQQTQSQVPVGNDISKGALPNSFSTLPLLHSLSSSPYLLLDLLYCCLFIVSCLEIVVTSFSAVTLAHVQFPRVTDMQNCVLYPLTYRNQFILAPSSALA